MDGCLVNLGGNIDAACSQHEWIRLAKGIVQIEPLEIDVCCGDWYLAEYELLSEAVDEIREEDGDDG